MDLEAYRIIVFFLIGAGAIMAFEALVSGLLRPREDSSVGKAGKTVTVVAQLETEDDTLRYIVRGTDDPIEAHGIIHEHIEDINDGLVIRAIDSEPVLGADDAWQVTVRYVQSHKV